MVKLNSGVDYRGTKRFANNKDCTQTGEENELSSSYKKKDRSFVRSFVRSFLRVCVCDARVRFLLSLVHGR